MRIKQRNPAQVFHAAGAPIAWDEQYVAKEVDPRTNSFVTRENLDSVLVRDRPPAPPIRRLSPTHIPTSLHYWSDCRVRDAYADHARAHRSTRSG